MKYLLLLLFILSSHVNGQKYVFATFPIEPWSINHNNKISGIIPDIANAIAAKAGISITFKFVPYARMVKEMRNGSVDLAIFSRNPNNDQFVNYLQPIFSQNIILLTRKGAKISSIDNLYQQENIQSIGVLRGANLAPKLVKDKNIIKYPFTDFPQGLKMLHAKRLDALLIIDKGSLYESNKLGLTNAFEFPGFPIKRLDAWLQVSKKSRHAKSFPYKATNQATKELASNGVFKQIMNKYISNTGILDK